MSRPFGSGFAASKSLLLSDEALDPLARVHLARVEIALRVDRQVVDPVELARVAARVGDPDRSISTLERLLSIPYEAPLAANPPLTPALLRLDPMFEPLRKDPRFQKLVAVSAPK